MGERAAVLTLYFLSGACALVYGYMNVCGAERGRLRANISAYEGIWGALREPIDPLLAPRSAARRVP